MVDKTLVQLPIGPGVYTEQTDRGATGMWKIADKVRFRKGLAEKIGGWVQLQPQFIGTCRRLFDWVSLDNKRWTAIATENKLYLWQDETLYDITPVRRLVTLTAPFDTTLGSSIVNVTDVNHGAQEGDRVRFTGAIEGGGLTIDGEYVIITIVDEDNYEIEDDEQATSTASNTGGTPNAEYDISAGATTARVATGYGAGPWSREGYGNARTGSTLVIGIRTWSLDNWGEDLLACPRGGPIYWWDRTKGASSRAVALGGDAPRNNEYVIISQRDRHVIALGAFDFFNNKFDPLLIRWCSSEDLNDWVPTSTNTSGDLRLFRGSRIVAGVRSRLELVIFTDESVHTLPFVGGFDVFGLNIVGENVSILGPNCAVPVDHRVFFMAEADFYMYDGITKVLPCDVRNYVYDNLNVVQKDKIYGGLNREFNEVWWFYPSYEPEAWVQTDFTLGLPPGYSLENSSSTPASLYPDVVFQADFETTAGTPAYSEESQYAESVTYNGNAQITTTNPIFDTASADFDGTSGTSMTFPIATMNLDAWDGAGKYMTMEIGFSADSMTSGSFDDRGILLVGDSDFNLARLEFEWSSGIGQFIRCGFANSGGIIDISDITLGEDYFIICEADYTGGAGNGVERVWFGTVSSGTCTLINTATGLTAKDPQSLGTQTIFVGRDSVSNDVWDGRIDHMRITVSDTARYDTSSTQTIPTTYETSGGPGGPADIGYEYGFNSGGWTEVQNVTGQNGYDYNYFLTNDEPIITPTEGEYAVELAASSSVTSVNRSGVLFLRQDLQGTPSTEADSFKGIFFTVDVDAGTIDIQRRDNTGAKVNFTNGPPGGSVNFETTVGVPAENDRKYTLTAAIDMPNLKCYLDGQLIFDFDLTQAEQDDHTGGSAGLYTSAQVNAEGAYEFYNFASGPLGVLTSADFDISPIEVNRYVMYNYEEGSWSLGKLVRTAWTDRSPVLEKAYAAGSDGYLYVHETGTDDNGEAMATSIESYDFEVPGAGEYLMHISELIPDFLTLEGQVDVFLSGRRYPQADELKTKGPYAVVPGTRKMNTRIKARQISLKVESTRTGDKWRMGNWRGEVGPHGKR